jgi:PAS domain S-box-containing protein
MASKPTYEELERRVKGFEEEATKRKRAEKALRESEERYRRITDVITDYIYTVRVQSGHPVETIHRPTCVAVTGYTVEDFEADPYLWIRMVHEEDRAAVQKQVAQVLSGVKVGTLEHRIHRKDGVMRWISNTFVPHYDAYGELLSYDGLIRDIHERKLVGDALRESEQRYRKVLEAIPDPVVVYDMAGNAVYLNPAFTRVFGWTPEELLGGKIDYVPEESWPETQAMIDKVLAGESFPEIESRRFTKTGNIVDVSIGGAIYLDVDGNPIGSIHILRDETEKRKLETQFRQARQMEAIATLAGGIAHEFNNALAGASGSIDLLQMDLPDDRKLHRHVERIREATHRMTNLTSQLLAYAKGGKYQVKTISLNELVERTVPLIRQSIDPAIQLEIDLPDDICSLRADLTQMQIVLLAVLQNSVEAIEGEGSIKIITRDEKIDEEFARTNPGLNPGLYVSVAIEDNGKGMDEDTKSRVFDPFFSTKFQGRGLSMAAVYGIVKNHGGWISLDSQRGKGTIVRIYLPAFDAKG